MRKTSKISKKHIAQACSVVLRSGNGRESEEFLAGLTGYFAEHPEQIDNNITDNILRFLECNLSDPETMPAVIVRAGDLLVLFADSNLDAGKHAVSSLAKKIGSIDGDPEQEFKLEKYSHTMEIIVKYCAHTQMAPHAAEVLAHQMSKNAFDISAVAAYIDSKCGESSEFSIFSDTPKIDFMGLFVGKLIAKSECARRAWRGKEDLVEVDKDAAGLYSGLEMLVREFPVAQTTSMAKELLLVVESLQDESLVPCTYAATGLRTIVRENIKACGPLDVTRVRDAVTFAQLEIEVEIEPQYPGQRTEAAGGRGPYRPNDFDALFTVNPSKWVM